MNGSVQDHRTVRDHIRSDKPIGRFITVISNTPVVMLTPEAVRVEMNHRSLRECECTIRVPSLAPSLAACCHLQIPIIVARSEYPRLFKFD
jgi:hypothetical protein